MSTADLILMAFRNLIKRKLRTALTVLGVTVGTASIVLMVSLGIGMNQSFSDMIKQMGNITVINVSSGGGMYMMDSSSGGAQQGQLTLDDKMINEFKNMEGVEVVTPVVETHFPIMTDKYSSWMSVRGIDMTMFDALGYKLEKGRNIEEGDKYGIVFGSYMENDFYDESKRNYWQYPSAQVNLLEDKLKLYVYYEWDERGRRSGKTVDVTGVGILQEGADSYYSFMDIEDLNKLIAMKEKGEKRRERESGYSTGGSNNSSGSKQTGYESVLVKCMTMKDVATVQKVIQEMGFYAWSEGEYLNSMKAISDSLQLLLGAIGAVSLFVAAIGITNTMLMSIYERTKEIGVMKVIGASLRDIKRLFLVEAAVIGFFGGLVGILVSLLGSYLLNNFGDLAFLDMISMSYYSDGDSTMSVIPVWLVLSGMIFSTVIGVLSGYFPARRAMNLSAIAAIRTE